MGKAQFAGIAGASKAGKGTKSLFLIDDIRSTFDDPVGSKMYRTNIAEADRHCRSGQPVKFHPDLQRALACVSFLQTLGAAGYDLLHHANLEQQNTSISDVLVMTANVGLPADFLKNQNFAQQLINLWLCQSENVLDELEDQANLFPGGSEYQRLFPDNSQTPADVLNGYRRRCLLAGVWWQVYIKNNPRRGDDEERDRLMMSGSCQAVKWRNEATQYGAMHLIRHPDFVIPSLCIKF